MPKKIVLFATGGTIASTGEPENRNLSATQKGEDLAGKIQGLADAEAEIEVINFSTVNSTNLTPDDMVEMAQNIDTILKREDISAAVVTHGTSLMEETAFVLDTLIDSIKPIVITGSQRNATDAWPDGPSNMCDALTVALCEKAENMGAMVVFGGHIYEGRYVCKVHTSALEAFSAAEIGALGSVFYNEVTFFRPSIRKILPLKKYVSKSVAIVPFYAGAEQRFLQCIADLGVDGIVVEGVGLGNVNDAYYDGIEYARRKGIEVIITTRCRNGRLIPMYAYKGGGASLKKLGVYFSSLPSAKARMALLLVLGGGFLLSDLQRLLN